MEPKQIGEGIRDNAGPRTHAKHKGNSWIPHYASRNMNSLNSS
jgi:hypothetical protein